CILQFITAPATAPPAVNRTVEKIGNSWLHVADGFIVKRSSWATPDDSQQVSVTQAGLLRITFSAYGRPESSLAILSSHSLCARSARSAMLGIGVPAVDCGVGQFSWFSRVRLARTS